MKREIKFKAADNLAPIRNQMMDLIDPNSRVIEFGCGKGDLLFKLSSQIKFGLGIDKSKFLIDYAIAQKKKKRISNVDFMCKELGGDFEHSKSYDFSIASLFFHVIPRAESIYLLNKMRDISDTILICGFSRPETRQQKFLLWLDQRFSGHFRNFSTYQKCGYLDGILAEANCSDVVTYDTHIPFVKIYKFKVSR